MSKIKAHCKTAKKQQENNCDGALNFEFFYMNFTLLAQSKQ